MSSWSMWRSKNKLSCHSSTTAHFVVCNRVSPCSGTRLMTQYASETYLHASPLHCITSKDHHTQLFYLFFFNMSDEWSNKGRSSCSQGKHFTDWAISKAHKKKMY